VDLSTAGADIERVIVTAPEIQARLKEIALQVEADYAGKNLLVIGILKGAVMTLADFVRSLNCHVEMDWMAVTSYGSGTKSSGVVRILKDLDRDISGRDVLIVEDIVDTGLTLAWLKSNLQSRGTKSVEIFTMLRKPDAAKVDVDVKYVGFDIPNEFVVGYGLDYNEKYRNLDFIGILAKGVYS